MQNVLFCSGLHKKLKIKTLRNIILTVVLYGFQTWLFILREERRLGVFGKWAVEENIWVIDGRGKGGVEKTKKKSLMIRTAHPILFR